MWKMGERSEGEVSQEGGDGESEEVVVMDEKLEGGRE